MYSKITSLSDFNELRIYIDGLLHLQYSKTGHVGVKSYTDGGINKTYWIDLVNEKGTIQLSYKNIKLWKAILKELNNSL